MIILMCDGSSKGNPGECRIGVVCWKRVDPKVTTPYKTISEPIGIGTNNDAEWRAVLKGLEFAKTLNDRIVFIYSDSMLVTQQAADKWKIKDDRMKDYKRKYDELCRGMEVVITWIPRQLTVLADKQT